MSGWRLYFTGLKPETLAATFVREGRLLDKRALRQMRIVSKLVMEQSIANSPVDWKGPKGMGPQHEIERSHRIEENYNRGRIEATVVVGGYVGSVNTDVYAEWLHESFAYSLGKASRAKTMSSAKAKVGPLFLERALKEYESEFDDLVDELMEGLMS